jgi:hypothetical protein
MKSFSQFWEEASLSDLQRQNRIKQLKRTKQQSDQRKSSAQRFTQKSKQKALSKRKEGQEKLNQQQERAEELKANKILQQQQARQRATETGRNVRHAAKGTLKLGKKIVKAVSNRRKRETNS